MRILIHGINFYPEPTGVGGYTAEMANWLASRGHDVRVVTAPPYYPEWRVFDGYRAGRYSVETWQGLQIWRCPIFVPSRPGGLRRLLHLASFAFTSFPVMLHQVLWRPDLVWVVEPTILCAPAALLVARLSGALAWLHVQDFELDMAFDLGFLQGETPRRMLAALERKVMREFDRVSTIAQRMLDRCRDKGVDCRRLGLFPNWARVEPATSREPADSLRSELGIGARTIVALYSGSMSKKQGLELLAQAALRLQSTPGLLFVFVGGGSGREGLKAKCDGLSNVRFLDLLPQKRLGALLSMADIHLLPQQAEAADLVMPSKLTGMLASGRPVVAACAEDTELADVVHDRGLVVPPGDPEAFVSAICLLAGDHEFRVRLGANARIYAQEHLAIDVVMPRFESELRRMVAGVA